MCMTKSEMNKAIEELRELKALFEETDQLIKEKEKPVIKFLKETAECEATDKNGKPIRQYIGKDYKVTYAMQTRENVNKEAVKKLLDAKQFESVTTKSTFGVLRIK